MFVYLQQEIAQLRNGLLSASRLEAFVKKPDIMAGGTMPLIYSTRFFTRRPVFPGLREYHEPVFFETDR